MVAGLGDPATSERVTSLSTVVEEGEEKNSLPHASKPPLEVNTSTVSNPLASAEFQLARAGDTETRNLKPEILEEDDDEEVSWQSAARASLEKTAKPATQPVKSSSTPAAKKVESPSATSRPVETKTAPQPEVLPPPIPESLPTEQFGQEELPPDFWGSESEPPPASSYDQDEAFETATSTPSNSQGGQARATSKPSTKLPFEMPLFNELQALFPGRIVRIEAKQQKQAEESEEGTVQTSETTSVVESEENE